VFEQSELRSLIRFHLCSELVPVEHYAEAAAAMQGGPTSSNSFDDLKESR
jgi:hypothetical protein